LGSIKCREYYVSSLAGELLASQGLCSMYLVIRNVFRVLVGSLKERDNLQDLGIGERIILKVNQKGIG